jgi:hypothetical protein
MPDDDLSSISGLDDRRRDVLGQKLGVSTCYELIMADRQRIVDAFGRRAIRPTLDEVSAWQDEARRIRAASLDAAISAPAASGWQSAATFVVAFEERGQRETLERRIVVEQTEVEPEASPQQRKQWPGWTCDDTCRWMLERVGAPAVPGPAPAASPADAIPEADPPDTGPPDTGPADTGPADTGPADTGPADTGPADTGPADTGPPDTGAPDTGAPDTGDGEAYAAAGLTTIDIERASLTDAGGSSEVVADSRPVTQDRRVWSRPARLKVTLGPGQSGPRTSVVLQLTQPGGAKQNIAGRPGKTGQAAEVDLSGLADGEYVPAIVASTRDGSLLPRIVKLPAIEVTGAGAGPSGARDHQPD